MIDLCIVTGASRGIGKAIAMEMGNAGSSVLRISKNAALYGRMIIKCDFNLDGDTLRDQVGHWLRGTAFGRIGIVLACGSLVEGMEESYRVNVLGNLAVVRGALPQMRVAKFGRILFFAGGGAAYANPLFPAYSASKTALVRITENLHEELKDQGDFAVTILSPGAVETDMLAQVRAAGGEIRTLVPMEEPVNFAREFLCSPNAKNLSGRFVHVRDNWREVLDGKQVLGESQWKLRRETAKL